MLTLAIALCLPQQPLPLDVGRRWTFEHDGQARTILEVVDSGFHRDHPSHTLRVRGDALFWHSSDLVLGRDGKGGIRQLAYVFQGTTHDEELPLLPAKLAIGDRWTCEMFAAHVFEQRELTVPAGTFETYGIEYELREHLGTENDLRVWVQPGFGIVQFEYWQESMRGRKSAIAPQRFELREALDLRRARFAPAPQLTPGERAAVRRAIASLRDASPDACEPILAELRPIGRGAVPLLLDAARAQRTAPGHRRNLERALHAFPQLRLTGSCEGVQKLGKQLRLSFRLHNDWPEALVVLPSLDDSDTGRMPSWSLQILDPDGAPVTVDVSRCGNCNPLSARDFRTLQPGEALDPFGPGTFPPFLLELFEPKVPGRYRARLTLDTTGEIPGDWETELDGPMDPAALPLLARLPRVRIQSNEVVFEVR